MTPSRAAPHSPGQSFEPVRSVACVGIADKQVTRMRADVGWGIFKGTSKDRVEAIRVSHWDARRLDLVSAGPREPESDCVRLRERRFHRRTVMCVLTAAIRWGAASDCDACMARDLYV